MPDPEALRGITPPFYSLAPCDVLECCFCTYPNVYGRVKEGVRGRRGGKGKEKCGGGREWGCNSGGEGRGGKN